MGNSLPHSFHIPVMGLGFTIDTPVKVARFGISSVISIIEDELVESMRKIYCKKTGEPYVPVTGKMPGHRAKRITQYLDLVARIVERQVAELRLGSFEGDSDLVRYFELLADDSPLKQLFREMNNQEDPASKEMMQKFLRDQVVPGQIDVNIMTKVDKNVYDADGQLVPNERSDALSALQGFAESTLSSSVVFSAGLNPRLFSFCETFPDFFPDENEVLKKKIILKVSDYRSALIQGKFLAKKGLWVSEFRVESGLNCGGHAFAAGGLLLGPVLEEFAQNREALTKTLFSLYAEALLRKNGFAITRPPSQRFTVQGGIGTADENSFLQRQYGIDGTGWGSPFLLVPEVTNVDDETLHALMTAKEEDYFLSEASPLGIPLNNFRKSSSEAQRLKRIENNRPGSPCRKKYLATNTEFTESPICTGSREYQHLKIRQLRAIQPEPEDFSKRLEAITAKECLCEGLGAAALLKNNAEADLRLKAVAICPGPNLAYFSGTFSLDEMVGHIYGRRNILNTSERPHMFIKELELNIRFLEKEIRNLPRSADEKMLKETRLFRKNLLDGISYYRKLFAANKTGTERSRARALETLETMSRRITEMMLQYEENV